MIKLATTIIIVSSTLLVHSNQFSKLGQTTPLDPQDAFFHGFWGNYQGADETESWQELAALLQTSETETRLNYEVTMGKDPTGKLVNGLLSTLNSLDDTDGIMKAMKIYGDEYYNRLMFWAWIHRLAKKMYETSMHELWVTNTVEKHVNVAVNVDQTKNRELLLRLFHYMINHYHGSSWSKMVKTLLTYKPFLAQALSQAPKDISGNIVAPDPKYQALIQQSGTNGLVSLDQLNGIIQDLKSKN
eukprot:53529_1